MASVLLGNVGGRADLTVQYSIIVPTYNRALILQRMLDSLLEAVRGTRDCEILVVDNGSSDGTRRLVESKATSDNSLRYINEPVPGLLSGRHRGALDSTGDICIFLDDDVLLGPEWLHAIGDAFRDPTISMVGGPSRPFYHSAVPDWLAEFYTEDDTGVYCSWLSLFDGGRQVKRIDPLYIFGLNFSIRRKALFDHGGFHPDNIPRDYQRFQGDGETGLAMKVRASSEGAIYHPDASVEHITPASRLTVEYFERRAYYQGVCDSYSIIRRDGTLPARAERGTSLPVRTRFGNVWRRLRLLKRSSAMKRATDRAYESGFAFHQAEVERDPALLEWVLRPDYWDYRLPATRP